MKVEFYVDPGFVGATRRETVEIPESELEGLSPEEQEAVVDERFKQWLSTVVEMGWHEVEEDEALEGADE